MLEYTVEISNGKKETIIKGSISKNNISERNLAKQLFTDVIYNHADKINKDSTICVTIFDTHSQKMYKEKRKIEDMGVII